MMDTFATAPKYDSYKNTGLEWLSEIPTEWNVEKAKWLFYKAERPVNKDDEIVTCFRDGQVTLRSKRRTEGFTNALKEHGYQGIRKGDLVIHAMDAFAGAIGISDSDGKSTPVYAACVPRIPNVVNPSFFAYYMRDLALSGFIVSLAKGIRERSTDFRFNDFAQLQLPLPSLSVQDKIVSFLDIKTTQIDEAIAIKEKQIALLKERKQIIIQKAVTQGLNPDVPMKNSGVDWIGKIPDHWEVKKLKYGVRIQGGFAFQSTDFKDEGVQLLKIANLYQNRLALERQPTFLSENLLKNYRDWIVKKGDILMSLTGTLGKRDYGFAILLESDEKYFLNQRVARLTAGDLFEARYLTNLLQSESYLNQIYQLPAGTKQANLSNDNVVNAYVPVPSFREQKEIADFIEVSSRENSKLITLQIEQIEQLKEYKTTLINSAVTGKIKVA